MATKKPTTPTKNAKPTPGTGKGALPRHPLARVKARFGSKADLVKALLEPLAAPDEDTDDLRARLQKASNQQLLRLHQVVTTVKEKWGSREKLIAAIGAGMNKAKDKDYLAKLASFSLPRLLDLAKTKGASAK